MRKTISAILALLFTVSMSAAAIPSNAVSGAIVDEIEVPYFDETPYFDGIVTVEEWGEPTVIVDIDDAATVEDTYPKENRFFMRNTQATPGFDVTTLKMYYELWFGWDQDYLYVAARVRDPDGHSLKNGRWNTWNGDALQFKIDPAGYNQVTGPEIYDAELDGAPWSGAVPDFCIGFGQSAGGYYSGWNNKALGSNGTGGSDLTNSGAVITVTPCGAVTNDGAYYSKDARDGITTYEVKIPWTEIDQGARQPHTYSEFSYKKPSGGIGREYGVSAAVYNADGNAGAALWNAGLSWGGGVIGDQVTKYPKTCAGSNRMVLSGDKLTDDPSYTGNYTKGNEGGYLEVAPYVDPVYDKEITSDDKVHVGPLTYDSEGDMEIFGSNYTTGGERVKDENGNWVVRWDLETDDLDASQIKNGYNAVSYLSTDTGIKNGETFIHTYDSPGCSMTVEFDVKFTGLESFEFDSKYGADSTVAQPPAFYSWFGGATGVENQCGYYFAENKFKVKDNSGESLFAEVPGNIELNKWYHWIFQYNKETCEVRLYVMPKVKNPGETEDRIDSSTAPLIRVWDKYLDAAGLEKCMPIFVRTNCQIMMDNIEYYNFVDWMNVSPPKPSDPPYVPQIIDKASYEIVALEDGTFSLNVKNEERLKDPSVTAIRFTLDLTGADGRLIFRELRGDMKEGFTAEDYGTTVAVYAEDLSLFRSAAPGDVMFSLIIAPQNGEKLSVSEVDGMISVKVTITRTAAQTGEESVIYYAAAALLAGVIASAVWFMIKRKRRIDFE